MTPVQAFAPAHAAAPMAAPAAATYPVVAPASTTVPTVAPSTPTVAPVLPSTQTAPVVTPTAGSATAKIAVSLPADARLLVDNVAIDSTSARRVFESPKLAPGQTYIYAFKAEFRRDGKTVVVNRNVRVWAGAEVNVSLSESPAVAAR